MTKRQTEETINQAGRSTYPDEKSVLRTEATRLHSLTHLPQEALGIAPVLKASDNIVGIAHQNHVAVGVVVPPPLSPEIPYEKPRKSSS